MVGAVLLQGVAQELLALVAVQPEGNVGWKVTMIIACSGKQPLRGRCRVRKAVDVVAAK